MSATKSSGPLRAVQWADASGVALRRPGGLPLSLRRGIRTVLFGDSMTDWYHFANVGLSSATYNSATGVLTLTYSAAHEFWSGLGVRVWHYSYASMSDHIYAALTVTGTTTATVQLAAGLSGVPDGALAAGLNVFADSHRGIPSFVNWAQMMGGWPLVVVRNAAQSGAVVLNNVRRLERDIAAYSPDLVIGQSPGINDLRAGDNRSESQIIADLTSLYDGILATGALLVVGTIAPVSSVETDRAYRGNMITVLRVNAWLRRYASGRPGMIVLDHHKHFVNPADANGLALASRVRGDGVHPATKTAIRIAKQLLAALSLPAQASSLPRSTLDCQINSQLPGASMSASSGVVTVGSANHKYGVGDEFFSFDSSAPEANGWFSVASVPDANTFTFLAPGVADGVITTPHITRSRNLFVNPLLLTTSGGTVTTGSGNTVTGAAAGNINVANIVGSGLTGVASVVAAENVGAGLPGYQLPVVGNEQVFAISAAAAGNVPAVSTLYGSAFAVPFAQGGRSYVFEGVLRLTSTDWTATWLANLYCRFAFTTTDGTVASIPTFGQDGAETDVIAEDMRLHIRSAVVRLPPGAAITSGSATWRVQVGATFSGPTLTMALSQINVLDVTGDEDSWL